MARFFRRGISKTYWLPSVAGASPTRAEITAGKDLSPQVTSIEGFSYVNQRQPTAKWGEKFIPQVEGPDQLDDCSMVLLDDNASTVIRSAVARGTPGVVLLLPYGDIPGQRCEVWPAMVAGLNDQWTTSTEPARFVVQFAVTDVPNQEAVIPAA